MSFERVEINEEFGEERWIRKIDPLCYVSVIHRMTGFDYMEWETALVFLHEVKDRPRTWKDRDCLIIGGDWREQLKAMPKEQLRDWYSANINGNRNSLGTIMEAIRSTIAEPDYSI